MGTLRYYYLGDVYSTEWKNLSPAPIVAVDLAAAGKGSAPDRWRFWRFRV